MVPENYIEAYEDVMSPVDTPHVIDNTQSHQQPPNQSHDTQQPVSQSHSTYQRPDNHSVPNTYQQSSSDHHRATAQPQIGECTLARV